MPTRQQKRARKRARTQPHGSLGRSQRTRRRGVWAFIATMTAILLALGVANALFPANRDEVKRGAAISQHRHATYTIEICGRPLADYPPGEGEIHTHGDGVIHLHPATQAFANDSANLGAFMASVESLLGRNPDGTDFLILPDGTRYEDGGTCQGRQGEQDLDVYVNGDAVDDPAAYLVQEGDDVIIRFGPLAPVGAERIPNPLTEDESAPPAEETAAD